MRVLDNTNTGVVTFGSLDNGDAFKLEGSIYMKIDDGYCDTDTKEKAVNLENAKLRMIANEIDVECVDAWVTVE